MEVNSARLTVWLYKILMGTLSSKKEGVLINNLDRKQRMGSLEPLERRVWAAFRLHPTNRRARRTYLRDEINAWEKRTQS